MPGFIAKKMCPKLRIQALYFDLYHAEAATFRPVAATYDPNFVTTGLDELTMDATDYITQYNSASNNSKIKRLLAADDVCAEFRARVEEATQLTCSGGVSNTAAFAKLASKVHKPNGQDTVTLRTGDEVLQHARDIPVRDVSGVDFAAEHQLHMLGIHACKDFLAQKAELCYLFRKRTFAFYLSAGLGLLRTHADRTIAECAAQGTEGSVAITTTTTVPVLLVKSTIKAPADKTKSPDTFFPLSPPQPFLQKSTGKSITFSRLLPSPEAFCSRLRDLVRGAHKVLVKQGAGTRHVCFFTMDHSFTRHSYYATVRNLTASCVLLLKAVSNLANSFVSRHRDFRLNGVSFNQLQRMPNPITLSSLSSSPSTGVAGTLGTAMKMPKVAAVSHHCPKRLQALPTVKKEAVITRPLKMTKQAKPKAKPARAAVTRTTSHVKKLLKSCAKVTPSSRKPGSRVAYVSHV